MACRAQGYPLRPELMESTFMLYEATGDDAYPRAGLALQQRLLARNRVECGFAGVSDVTTGATTTPRPVKYPRGSISDTGHLRSTHRPAHALQRQRCWCGQHFRS